MCEEKRKNIEEIPEMYLKGLSFHYVNDVSEVLNFALLDEKVKNAIEFTFDEPKNETKGSLNSNIQTPLRRHGPGC